MPTSDSKRPSVIAFDSRWFNGMVEEFVACVQSPTPLIGIASPRVLIAERAVAADDDLLDASETVAETVPEEAICPGLPPRASASTRRVVFSRPSGVVLLLFSEAAAGGLVPLPVAAASDPYPPE